MELKISEHIRALRMEQNWSQRALAEKLNVSFQSVSKWESGQNYPDIETLVRIAQLFGVTVDELLRGRAVSENLDQRMKDIYACPDPDERIGKLGEMRKLYPRNFRVLYEYYLELKRLEEPERSKYRDMRRQLLREMIPVTPPGFRIRVYPEFYALANESEVEPFLSEYSLPMGEFEQEFRELRCIEQKDEDGYQRARAVNLCLALHTRAFPRLAVTRQKNGSRAWAEDAVWASRMTITMIDTLTGTACGRPVSGDGVPDLWIHDRLPAAVRLAEALCTLGQIDEALTVLEDAADLWCAVWALEPDTQMTFRCPALVPLSSQLCRGGICGGGTGLYAWSELADISCALKGPGFAPLAVEPRFRVLSDRIKEAVRVSPLNRSPKLSE